MFKLSILSICALACLVQCELELTPVPIISSESVLDPDGKYHYNYETADGISAHAEGHLKEVGDVMAESIEGGYEYTAPDGQKIAINYLADETGYHPTGDAIPVAPPLSESTVKLLRYLEEHP